MNKKLIFAGVVIVIITIILAAYNKDSKVGMDIREELLSNMESTIKTGDLIIFKPSTMKPVTISIALVNSDGDISHTYISQRSGAITTPLLANTMEIFDGKIYFHQLKQPLSQQHMNTLTSIIYRLKNNKPFNRHKSCVLYAGNEKISASCSLATIALLKSIDVFKSNSEYKYNQPGHRQIRHENAIYIDRHRYGHNLIKIIMDDYI
jgi:hypothetical protein